MKNLIIKVTEENQAEQELAMIRLPGARAGVIMLEELEKRAENIQIGKPTSVEVETADEE